MTTKKFQLERDAEKKAQKFLQMPPVLKITDEEAPVISSDPDIEMFETNGCNYVFTDITYGIPKRVLFLHIFFTS